MSGLKMLGLTARTLMVLERAGVTEVEQLCQMKSWRVLSIPGLGKVSYKEIASGMTAHGLHFEDSEPKDSPCATPQASGIHSVSLRDYFAAKALQGLISTAGAPCLLGVGGCENETASTAYKLADAMLLARRASHGG